MKRWNMRIGDAEPFRLVTPDGKTINASSGPPAVWVFTREDGKVLQRGPSASYTPTADDAGHIIYGPVCEGK